MSGIHPVSSQEHMLNPPDIFIVAAYEDKVGQSKLAPAAKKADVTPERMLYSSMIQEYSDERLIRIRAGNTLFTIAAFEGRVGWVRFYNGDVHEILINNLNEFFESARKIGFDGMFFYEPSPETLKVLKEFVNTIEDPKVQSNYNSKDKVFAIVTGDNRG